MLLDVAGVQRSSCLRGWPEVLARHSVGVLILDRISDSELVAEFEAHPEWTVDFQDPQAVIFAHSGVL
jgi:hypothetical protein